MLVRYIRCLYPLSSIKPSSRFLVRNTRLAQCFGTDSKNELKSEDTFGDYVSDLACRYPEDYCEDEPKGSGITIIEAIHKIRKFIDAYEFDNAHEVFKELSKTKSPPPYIYKLLFASAARLGKVEEAFKLYNDLKKRGLYVDGAMYTSLFYACAKCPRADIALPIANKILEHMFNNKKQRPNKSNFNAVLMAYGRHGDISTVMLLIDKLEKQEIHLSCRNYNFALESCISQKNSGLRFAILIWHHMRKKKIVPDRYTFTVLGRCVRDCSLGDSDLCDDFIKSIFEKRYKRNVGQKPLGLNAGGLVIKLKESCQETDASSSSQNKEEQMDISKVMRSSETQVTESGSNISIDTENKEKIEEKPHLVKRLSLDEYSLPAGNKEESQDVTCTEIANSLKEVCLVATNKEESQDIIHTDIANSSKGMSVAAANKEEFEESSKARNTNQPQVNKIGTELCTKVETYQFDESYLPNLLTLKRPGKSVIKFEDFSTPENRLLLFGGMNGFLQTMKDFKVKPDIVLFSILLECIPSTRKDEEALMREMKAFKVRVDTTFLNILIRRKLLRNEESTLEDFMNLLKTYKCAPDVVTIGTLARSCVTHENGKKCIELARSHNIRLNNRVLGCLLVNAGKIGDVNYVSDILAAAKEDSVELDARFTSNLKSIVDTEKIRRKNMFPKK